MQRTFIGSTVGALVFVSVLLTSTTLTNLKSADHDQSSKATEFADDIRRECRRDAHCMSLDLMLLAKQNGKSLVTLTASKLIDTLDSESTDCHDIAHHIGIYLFSLSRSIQESFNSSSEKCRGGLYHGIVEGYFVFSQSSNSYIGYAKKGNVIDVTSICPPDLTFLQRWHCVHGIGHGLAYFYNYDAIRAAEYCNNFAKTWEQLRCYRGAFMETSTGKLVEELQNLAE